MMGPDDLTTIAGQRSAALRIFQEIAKHLRQLLGAAWRRHAAGDRAGALRLALRAWRSAPMRLQILRSIASLVVKPVGPRTSERGGL